MSRILQSEIVEVGPPTRLACFYTLIMRRRVLSVFIAFLSMTMAFGTVTGASSNSQFGKIFRNGPYKFHITGSKCGISWVGVGSTSLGLHPVGQFCRVSIRYENVTNGPTAIPGYYTVTDKHGRVYAANTIADIYGNAASLNADLEVNPGYGHTYKTYFEIPRRDSLRSFTFHASYGDKGTTVSL